MCGIFGISTKKDSGFPAELLKHSSDRLFRLSESRGREASGCALSYNNDIKVLKSAVPASDLIRSDEYKEFFSFLDPAACAVSLIGHTRLVTNGALEDNRNNQPVVKDGIVGVHNGIVVNDQEIWEAFPQLKKEYEVDTEVVLALMKMFLNQGKTAEQAMRNVFSIFKGSASLALFFENDNRLALATNTGSLYICFSENVGTFFFASEHYILEKFLKWKKLKKLLKNYRISQLRAGSGLIVDIATLHMENIILKQSGFTGVAERTVEPKSPEIIRSFVPKHLFVDISQQVNSLKRCAKCILPETMPFIEFDEQGVCNFCRNYKKLEFKGEKALQDFVAPFRKPGNQPDCIVTLSGGRDSSFSLHYAKKVLGLNPIAYSYDWGMVTDLARRNQARMCGELGVEHILVSADIKKKRDNIRKNVLAWLRSPDLGMVPLFMAGDKQYFYYANKLRRQMAIDLIILAVNPSEKTDFKHGFCGIRQKPLVKSSYRLSWLNKIKIALYYSKQFLNNPAYLNSSLFNTLTAFFSFYSIPHDYLFLYRYIPWEEEKIITVLTSLYNWEKAQDTKDTWRIGDGTASFYNYIYYLIAGFTENDTFQSNQVREGIITRDEALDIAKESNQPRYESIKWYCDTIGIDFEKTLQIINSIQKLY